MSCNISLTVGKPGGSPSFVFTFLEEKRERERGLVQTYSFIVIKKLLMTEGLMKLSIMDSDVSYHTLYG